VLAARLRLAIVVCLTASLACTREPQAVQTEEPEPPAPLTLRGDRTDLIFSYTTDGKRFETATSIDAVPATARKAVVVTDLSLTPEARQSARYVHVADLTSARADGTYPVAVASRHAFELASTATSSAAVSDGVVVYSASWCGVCKKTKRLLDAWGVRYVEKDIEASETARAELAAKSRAAGIQPSGVPVIDVGGVLLQGLDEAALRAALEQKGFSRSR
jgi:glutaredoxin